MRSLAEYKLELWNRPRYEKKKQKVSLEAFNPNSAKQTCEIFQMLKIPAKAYSKDTGEPSWGRDQIEELRKESKDETLIELLDAMIDNSFSSIIKTNFIKAFDTFTIDGVLHGKINLFGAKSFRNTSNSPNLLNAPSTKSIYAKPLKRCFKAKDDFVIYTADLSALEDRVISNLSGDVNKCNVFKEGLDGHSLNACGYYPKEIERVIGKFNNDVDRVKAFMQKNNEENSVIKDLRQKSKGPTFKLAYGGFPDVDKGGVITQEIFDRYHNVLYPGITDYRENYVLPTAVNNGYIHLGLGCRLYTDDPNNDIRTLHNATVQFWSILTLIAVNELNYRIEQEKLQKYVQVQSTIYDSIYTQTYRDPEIIKWVNDNLIEVMTVQYLENEQIHNEAEGLIGLNWADLYKVPNNASIQQVKEVLALL
jgi:DNA polymerase-1